jgi:hypothetical protein
MNRLQRQFDRLFRAPDASADNIELIDSDGRVKTLVITVARSRDWPNVAGLISGLQETLGLPLPAVAVDGKAGFQLWLPLAEPVALETAASFLSALRRQYLGDIADTDLVLLPLAGGPGSVRCIPALSAESGRWSAFIDPTMGGMFTDEGGLDFEPNPDRQADQLASISPIEPADFASAMAVLTAVAATTPASAESASVTTIGRFSEPRDFLMAVMNEPSAPLALRIEAAKALLAQGRS